jgi:hypothetical protein
MEAEHQRALSEKAHLETTAAFAEAEKKCHRLESKLLKYAIKAKPYFEAKDVFNSDLQEQRKRVYSLQKEISLVKQKYSDSLQNLECISDRIHARRRLEAKKVESLNVEARLEDFEGRSEEGSESAASAVSSDVDEDDEGFDSVTTASSSCNRNSDAEDSEKAKESKEVLPDSLLTTLNAASIS